MPGMMRLRDASPNMQDFLKKEGRVPESGDDWPYEDWKVLPDFSDPATVGCLVALVREVRKEPDGNVIPVTPDLAHPRRLSWMNGLPYAQKFRLASTEVEALLLALEDL